MADVMKENCWKSVLKDGTYFMKYYEDFFVAQKVKFVHEQLSKCQFPYHIKLEANEDMHILKQRWFNGKSADYKKRSEQQKALQALQALHETKDQIDWQQFELLPQYDLMQKWQRRYVRFKEQEASLRPLLHHSYDTLVDEAQQALKRIANMNRVIEPMTILHGDVVHHNVMIAQDEVKLIDFDLAAIGESSDELILWMHRVLSQTSYQLQPLLQAHPYLQKARHKLAYLNFPNEIMRESLFYVKLNDRAKRKCYPFIQALVEDWQQQKQQLKSTIQTLVQ